MKQLLNKLQQKTSLPISVVLLIFYTFACHSSYDSDTHKIKSFLKKQAPTTLDCLTDKEEVFVIHLGGCPSCLTSISTFLKRNKQSLACTGFVFVGDSERTVDILVSDVFQSAAAYCFMTNLAFHKATGIRLQESVRIRDFSTKEPSLQWLSTLTLEEEVVLTCGWE